jgi:hypothetical protein
VPKGTGVTNLNGTGAAVAGTFAVTGATTLTEVTHNSANITGVTTASSAVFNANSLTTGTGIYAASSTLTSGKLLDLQVSGTAAAAGHVGLNIGMTGANATSSITTTGATISNTRTGTGSNNYALDLTASGGATNVALHISNGGMDITGVSVFRSNISGVTGSAASFNYFTDVLNTTSYFQTNADSTHSWTLINRAAASGRVLLSVQGAASQSADLQQWQNSSATVLAKVDSAGNLSTTGTLAVTGATTLTGNLTSNGALISTPQALSGAGAVNVTTLTTAVTTTAPAQALTLADGTNGQIKTIVHQALSGGGTWVLTPTTKTGYTTITSIAVGETCTLQFFTTIGWCILSLRGAIAA